jgi:uncharacterized membrane protein YhaH (DUF805 family)
MKQLDSLDFLEAIQLASRHILDFKGRSRRSEFWWWMLVVMIAKWVFSSFSDSLLTNAIAAIIIIFFGLAATVRRLHDTGKSALWVYISYAMGCVVQIFNATSTTMNKLMHEVTSGHFTGRAIEKIVEDGAEDLYMLSTLSFVSAIFAIIVIFMCLLDSSPYANKYGESPKYVEE